MTDNRRVTKVIGAVNKKILEGKNIIPEKETQDDVHL